MRLYLVTDRPTARALQEARPLNWVASHILDDLREGTVKVPALVFYDFRWLADVATEFPDAGYDQCEEMAVEIPPEAAAPYERPCHEGGNSTWRLPQTLVSRYLVVGHAWRER
jgi:hypothetical protein